MKEGVEQLEPGAGTALLKIAYEYLALHVGKQIYDSRLDLVRSALHRNDPSGCGIKVQSLMPRRGRDNGGIHGLAVFLGERNQVEVLVCLFGNCLWRIEFPWIFADPATFNRFAYELQLAATPKCSRIVHLNEEAEPESSAASPDTTD